MRGDAVEAAVVGRDGGLASRAAAVSSQSTSAAAAGQPVGQGARQGVEGRWFRCDGVVGGMGG